MQLTNSSDRYGAVPQFLHWIIALLVIVAWLLGSFGDDLPRGGARETGLSIHIWLGLAILALVIIRFAWRLLDPPPKPEQTPFGEWAERAGALAHYALYILLLVVPLVGIVLQFARGDALPVFGLFEIPSPWIKDRAFAKAVKEVHELAANALLIVAAFHAAAALFHHWVLRDRTLSRMLPRA